MEPVGPDSHNGWRGAGPPFDPSWVEETSLEETVRHRVLLYLGFAVLVPPLIYSAGSIVRGELTVEAWYLASLYVIALILIVHGWGYHTLATLTYRQYRTFSFLEVDELEGVLVRALQEHGIRFEDARGRGTTARIRYARIPILLRLPAEGLYLLVHDGLLRWIFLGADDEAGEGAMGPVKDLISEAVLREDEDLRDIKGGIVHVSGDVAP